jgi:hypothetical protein
MKKFTHVLFMKNIFKKGKNKKLHYIVVWSLDSLIKKITSQRISMYIRIVMALMQFCAMAYFKTSKIIIA